MSSAWYEVLSVLHLMAALSFLQANLLLLPRMSSDGYQPKVSEGGYLFHAKFLYDVCQLVLLSLITDTPSVLPNSIHWGTETRRTL